ncbi:MAG TPA: hypothetical protein PK289_00140 [Bacteroidia bacterium]|nr:hypothetical protein [Bacteroidia bacterium]
MEKFTHKFTGSGIAYKIPTVPNFVTTQIFRKEQVVSLNDLSYPELVEYAEAVKQSIIRKHKK